MSLFQNYAKNGDNRQLKQFAENTLPVLEQHLQMAQSVPQGTAQQNQVGEKGPESGRVVVQQPAPAVRVEQAAPHVTVQQPQPQVTVRQPQPEITVRMPNPEVKVTVPQPQVAVNQPQPLGPSRGAEAAAAGPGKARTAASAASAWRAGQCRC